MTVLGLLSHSSANKERMEQCHLHKDKFFKAMKDRTLPQREKKCYIFKMSLNKQAIYREDRQLWIAAKYFTRV